VLPPQARISAIFIAFGYSVPASGWRHLYDDDRNDFGVPVILLGWPAQEFLIQTPSPIFWTLTFPEMVEVVG
jgi:hypothetical protein